MSSLTEDGEAIVLRELGQNDVKNLRNLLYWKFGKRNVIVRSAEQEEGETLQSCGGGREMNTSSPASRLRLREALSQQPASGGQVRPAGRADR